MRRTLPVAGIIAAVTIAGLIGRRTTIAVPGGEGPSALPRQPSSPSPRGTRPPPPDTSLGLRCIRGGTTREEVRAIMGEPDSIAFGDWLYGRSSITFGYGVVLDYSSPDGKLVVCP